MISKLKKFVRMTGRYGFMYATAVLVGGVALGQTHEYLLGMILITYLLSGGVLGMLFYAGMNSGRGTAYNETGDFGGAITNVQTSKQPILFKAGIFGIFLTVESLITMLVLKATIGL